MAAISRSTRWSTWGRWTFTTTSSPLRSRAACTWAIEAAAIGAVSKCSNTSPSGRPRSDSTTLRTTSNAFRGNMVPEQPELAHQLRREHTLPR